MAAPEQAIETYHLTDDGLVPNNSALALIVIRAALEGDACNEQAIIQRLAANGWRGAWINGIYPFHHYHARSHEVLVISRGWARVQFGGTQGPILALQAGDGVVIPAGVGHRRNAASADLIVVGAYPAGQEDWDLKRPTVAEHALALTEIPHVMLPPRDPFGGLDGPVVSVWLR